MSYRELGVPPALAGLVECGWVDTAAADDAHEVLPDGCMDLVWTGAQLVVAGPDTVAQHGHRTRGVTVAGLRFLPGALPSLLGVPAAPLHNRRVPLADLLPGAAGEALARLEAGAEPVGVLAALAVGLPGPPPDRSVAALRRALAPAGAGPAGAVLAIAGSANVWPAGVGPTSAGPTSAGLASAGPQRRLAATPWRLADPSGAGSARSIAALADALGCTPRSVHRRCLAAFGYGPAVLRRVLRFRRAAALLRAGMSPAAAAAAAGYADQPHLSRETRALAGVSPGQLARGANRLTSLPSGSSTTA